MTPTDNNPLSFFGLTDQVVTPSPLADLAGVSDAVKFSHCYKLTVDGQGQLFRSGSEQVLDAVRCRELTLKNFVVEPGAENAITLKGWVKGFTLEDLTLTRHSAGTQDIDLGNWSDYDRVAFTRAADGSLVPLRWLPKTTGGVLRRVKMVDGSRVRVRCLYADRPALDDSCVEWVNAVPFVPNSLFTAAYFGASRAGLIATRTPTNENAVLQPWETL